MKTIFQVRVQRNGRITLPKELRDSADIEAGSRLTLHDLGNGVVIMSHTSSRLTKVADQLAQEWREAGESLDSMLATLRQVRKKRSASKR